MPAEDWKEAYKRFANKQVKKAQEKGPLSRQEVSAIRQKALHQFKKQRDKKYLAGVKME